MKKTKIFHIKLKILYKKTRKLKINVENEMTWTMFEILAAYVLISNNFPKFSCLFNELCLCACDLLLRARENR